MPRPLGMQSLLLGSDEGQRPAKRLRPTRGRAPRHAFPHVVGQESLDLSECFPLFNTPVGTWAFDPVSLSTSGYTITIRGGPT